ncbi:MAG: modulator of FtsH protease HflC [Kosmotogales bacterium]|nr:modulator of FtsH protease HflC [Kosmotogales bacterium]
MTKIKWIILVVVVIVAAILLPSFFFIVDQTEFAVVTRFGDIIDVVLEPGLNTKAPFIDVVEKFDKRIRTYDVPPERIYTKDKKTLLVDTYALWKIDDPENFVKKLKTIDLASTRIDDVVYSVVRNTFGKLNYDDIISEKRDEYLGNMSADAAYEMADYGIAIIEVRVLKTDLPDENRNAVFERMKSERNQEASLIRAEGERTAQEIRAGADKEVTILLADAEKTSDIIKGTGEASAVKIYAEAFGADEDFYEYQKTLEVYRETLDDAEYILGPQMEFLKDLIGGN